MKKMKSSLLCLLTTFVLFTGASEASAAISFVSGTNSVSLKETITDEGSSVFVFDGTAENESTVLTFSTDSSCPGVAMTGGAEFGTPWTCVDGVITATVTDRGGMSFGPGPEGAPSTFYVTFSDPPAPPGAEASVAALSGIQISVFGDISRWDLEGNTSAAGAVFGVELTGPEGGDAHFRMYLPQAAADFLGGVLGVFVGGKPDPFAAVNENEDGSVSIEVDIAKLVTAPGAVVGKAASRTVTKKITAGQRSLSVGFDKSAVKTGKNVTMKVCAGTDFVNGDKVTTNFTLGGNPLSLKKSVTLNATGCGQVSIKLKGIKQGTLTAKVAYKSKRAKTTLKITK